MGNIMKYNGYLASVRFEEADLVFVGKVMNASDSITFESESAPGLVEAFHQAIDDYLAYCEEKGIKPQKPFNGDFMVRSDAELHRQLFELATVNGKSMNDFAVEALRRVVDEKKKAA